LLHCRRLTRYIATPLDEEFKLQPLSMPLRRDQADAASIMRTHFKFVDAILKHAVQLFYAFQADWNWQPKAGATIFVDGSDNVIDNLLISSPRPMIPDECAPRRGMSSEYQASPVDNSKRPRPIDDSALTLSQPSASKCSCCAPFPEVGGPISPVLPPQKWSDSTQVSHASATKESLSDGYGLDGLGDDEEDALEASSSMSFALVVPTVRSKHERAVYVDEDPNTSNSVESEETTCNFYPVNERLDELANRRNYQHDFQPDTSVELTYVEIHDVFYNPSNIVDETWRHLLAGFISDFDNLELDMQHSLIARLEQCGSRNTARELWSRIARVPCK
jgi:hypothetical protein